MSNLDWVVREWNALTSRQPYWHPLGFVSCLLREGEGSTIRLHYWPKNDRRPKTPNWPIHNHRFDLQSEVLNGTIRDARYNLIEPESRESYVIYSVKYNGIHSEIVPTGRVVGLRVRSIDIWAVNSVYRIPFGDFHETIVEFEDEALTLVECSNFQPVDPSVVGRLGEASVYYQRAEFNRMRFWQVVESILLSRR